MKIIPKVVMPGDLLLMIWQDQRLIVGEKKESGEFLIINNMCALRFLFGIIVIIF